LWIKDIFISHYNIISSTYTYWFWKPRSIFRHMRG